MVETLLLGILLLVPLIWALTVLSDLHRGALAASAAAREAGFEAARATSSAAAAKAADAAVRQAFIDEGLEPSDAIVALGASSLQRGSAVTVEVSYPVTVLQAPLLGRVAGPSVIVRARHVARVALYGSRT